MRPDASSFVSDPRLFVDLQLQNTKTIRALIVSGSPENLMDTRFAFDNGYALQNPPNPLSLTLGDGSAPSQGPIPQSTTLDVEFPCGTRHSVCFLLTTLHRSAVAVLGFSWLRQHNPLIDWTSHKITFRSSTESPPLEEGGRIEEGRVVGGR